MEPLKPPFNAPPAKPAAVTPAYQKPETVKNRTNTALQVGPEPINTNMSGRDISKEFKSRPHPTGHSRKGR